MMHSSPQVLSGGGEPDNGASEGGDRAGEREKMENNKY